MSEIPAHVRTQLLALEEFASLFLWEMERLDHTGHFDMSRSPKENWLTIPDNEREIYVSALEVVFLNRDLVLRALGEGLPKNDGVDGG
jgi:hypothetical protein